MYGSRSPSLDEARAKIRKKLLEAGIPGPIVMMSADSRMNPPVDGVSVGYDPKTVHVVDADGKLGETLEEYLRDSAIVEFVDGKKHRVRYVSHAPFLIDLGLIEEGF